MSSAIDRAVKILAREIKRIMKLKGHVVFGVVGGRSVSKIYTRLIKEIIDWDKVDVLLCDEHRVSKQNYKIAMNLGNVHKFSTVSRYNKTLIELGGKFDVVLLSSGEDGHIASLFPHHLSILDKSCGFIKVDKTPKDPQKRMSASRKLLEKSEVGILLFFGKYKKNAYKCFKNNQLKIKDCPAKIIEKMNKSYVIKDF